MLTLYVLPQSFPVKKLLRSKFNSVFVFFLLKTRFSTEDILKNTHAVPVLVHCCFSALRSLETQINNFFLFDSLAVLRTDKADNQMFRLWGNLDPVPGSLFNDLLRGRCGQNDSLAVIRRSISTWSYIQSSALKLAGGQIKIAIFLELPVS